ncbi:MAG: DHH family phosphoesterase [Christensenellaceae bacterium]|nr:DHH family phosphoesterase [Christensenellaceae bacterium]
MRKRLIFGEAFWTKLLMLAFAAIGCIGACVHAMDVRLSLVIISAGGCMAAFFVYVRRKRNHKRRAADILEREAAIDKYINATTIPTAVIEDSGKIFWQNPAFGVLTGVESDANIYRMLPELTKPDKNARIRLSGKDYKRELITVASGGKEYQLLRLINKEKAIETVNANRAMLPVMCNIEIDNYSGLVSGLPIAEVSQLSSLIDQLVSEFADELQGMLIKYKENRYHICFEHRLLGGAQDKRFPLLDKVRRLETSTGLNPTLSIAVGSGDTPRQSGEFARQAMDLARGRGGDQAVVKKAGGYTFYGGVQRAVEVNTRVRSRTVSKALRNLMEQCENVFIMGHAVPDMDCLGSALGLVACARVLEKPAYIVLDRPNAAVQALLEDIKENPEYREVFVTPGRAHLMMSARSMLIVVDTQSPKHTLAPSLLEVTENLVVIDHHLKGTQTIDKAVLFYHEPYASSASEMVCELVQYFADNVRLRPIESESLMAGITIDTKGFSFKTGVRTFEAASFLRRAGATTTSVRHLYQDDLETFLDRAAVVKAAQVRRGVAISQCPRDCKSPELLAAQAADSLIGIKGLDASFVMCESGGRIGISGRSLGKVNVQMILEKLGGGGHATIAGAQVKGREPEEIRAQLWQLVGEYLDDLEKEKKESKKKQ